MMKINSTKSPPCDASFITSKTQNKYSNSKEHLEALKIQLSLWKKGTINEPLYEVLMMIESRGALLRCQSHHRYSTCLNPLFRAYCSIVLDVVAVCYML